MKEERAVEWTFKVGWHEQEKLWYVKSFPETDSEVFFVAKDKREVVSLLMDHLSMVFSYDNGCVDEREFWSAAREVGPDLREFRQNEQPVKLGEGIEPGIERIPVL